MRELKKNTDDLQILECTLRDGSYAVDFRFTYADTALLCRLMSNLGFRYLEVGHGLGINASEAGKGKMPASDEDIARIAKENATGSKIGMFCIPGIARLGDLKSIRDAGLDFVRVGNNAEDVEKAFPYLEESKKQGFFTALNFMKSYAITPKEFAARAKEAVKNGAEVIYLVDSAGCMLPEQVDEYIKRTKDAVDVKVGFHGHNNLHLAVANSLQAIESGATFIDTTLYGIGRNAGNAPTEVMVALLKSMGKDTGIDLIELMDVIDEKISPLMRQIQMYDMLSLTMGLAKFHSSFLPQVEKIAKDYHVDIRKLILEAGRIDASKIDEEKLREYAKKESRKAPEKSPDVFEKEHDLLSFCSSKIRHDRISNTLESVENLLEELTNVAAKSRARIFIELFPLAEEDSQLVFSDYITSTQDLAMGRIKFGSKESLEKILEIIRQPTSLILIDSENTAKWLKRDELYDTVVKFFDKAHVITYSLVELIKSHIVEMIINYRKNIGSKNLILFGTRAPIRGIAERLWPYFEYIFLSYLDGNVAEISKTTSLELPSNCIELDESKKSKDMDLNTKMGLCFLPLVDLKKKAEKMPGGMTHIFYVDFFAEPKARRFEVDKGISYIGIDILEAYRWQFPKWIAMSQKSQVLSQPKDEA